MQKIVQRKSLLQFLGFIELKLKNELDIKMYLLSIIGMQMGGIELVFA